jgi:hypothetical protein
MKRTSDRWRIDQNQSLASRKIERRLSGSQSRFENVAEFDLSTKLLRVEWSLHLEGSP